VRALLATAGLLAGVVTVVAGAAPAAAAPALPSGFLLQEIPTGFGEGDLLTDFAFLPDESLLLIGKGGKVGWAPRTGTPRTIANLTVRTDGDLGLVGLALAPDYATSHVIYTARTVPGTGPGSGQHGLLRLSSWRVDTDTFGAPTGLSGERILVQTAANSNMHAMWGVATAEDGSVWLSIGDSADAGFVDSRSFSAQDLDDPHGKLLHLRPDGTGLPSNPYYDPANPGSVRSLIYVSGFRSPFRFSLDPGSGRPVLGDVGWNSFEEIDIVNPGNNYGWPCWEGFEPTPSYHDLPECAGTTTASPLYAYRHAGTSSLTGGVVYTGAAYPAEYRGRYFYGDYADQQIFTLGFNERGELTTPPEAGGFGNDIGAPVKFATMPSGGDIVYADILTSRIQRLAYAPGNNPPAPAIRTTVDPTTRTVTFNATDSFDPNGDPLTYHWNFGDDTSADGPTTSHVYPASPDHFPATLTVTDPFNASATMATTVYPGNNAPALSVNAPRDDQTFAVGDVISASAGATDPEDGSLPVTWNVVLVHCHGATSCHNHPGEQQTGPNFRMTFEGHPGDTRLEITASATDSRGAVSSRTFVAHPKQHRVTVLSNSPANFTIGDQQTTSGLFTVGMPISVIAPDAAVDGVATFDRWSDGSTNRVRPLTVPNADTTFTAGYLTPIDRRYATDAGLRALVGTPTDVEQGDSGVRWRVYTTGRLYWAAASGVHETHGTIMNTYNALGGYLFLGVPTTDEAGLPDGTGRISVFERGAIYWSPTTDAHEVYGAILGTWAGLGYERSYLGYPITGELSSGDGAGRANFFQRGSIHWTPQTGAHEVQGSIYNRWAALGWHTSYLGYPTTGEQSSADGIGKANFFQRGALYWTPATGAWEVQGAIYNQWAALGWHTSYLGYPTTGEQSSADGVGKASFFQRGALYWTQQTGAHEVQGSIYNRWAALGWHTSYLGYPVTGEFAIPGGRRSNFQNGYITWNATTGQVTDRRY
jgi:uncharacterized protein with LGFP repeats/glucose/arabinose dehydrogenase